MNIDRDRDLLGLAVLASDQSPDTTKVGCILTAANGALIASGYNALPRGVRQTEERLSRPAKYQWTLHAETRAIGNAARMGGVTEGGSAHVTYFPCASCAQQLIECGIRRVVAPEPNFRDEKWGEDWTIAATMFWEAGVEVVFREVPDVPQ